MSTAKKFENPRKLAERAHDDAMSYFGYSEPRMTQAENDRLNHENSKKQIAAGLQPIHRPMPSIGRYSWHEKNSQGTLAYETPNFPDGYDPAKTSISSRYIDRLEHEVRREVEPMMRYNEMPCWKQEQWDKFTRLFFDTDIRAIHVRIIYYYNVASGYDTPVVVALFPKDEQK